MSSKSYYRIRNDIPEFQQIVHHLAVELAKKPANELRDLAKCYGYKDPIGHIGHIGRTGHTGNVKWSKFEYESRMKVACFIAHHMLTGSTSWTCK